VSTLLMIIFVPLFFAAIFAADPPLIRLALIVGIFLILLMLVVEVLDLILTAFICVYLWPFVLSGIGTDYPCLARTVPLT